MELRLRLIALLCGLLRHPYVKDFGREDGYDVISCPCRAVFLLAQRATGSGRHSLRRRAADA